MILIIVQLFLQEIKSIADEVVSTVEKLQISKLELEMIECHENIQTLVLLGELRIFGLLAEMSQYCSVRLYLLYEVQNFILS